MFSKEDVELLAYRRYKTEESSVESYDKSIWYLSELCCIINSNVENGYDIKPLETDNLILLIREDVNGELIKPSEEEVKDFGAISIPFPGILSMKPPPLVLIPH